MKNLQTPYYMAFFTIELSEDLDNFEETSLRMNELVAQQEGYLGGEDMETTDGKVISVCYWKNLENIKTWRSHVEHQMAIEQGKKRWFSKYKIQIAEVKYGLESNF